MKKEGLADMSDEELVRGCVAKNTLAQKILYDRYCRKMMGVCMRYASCHAQAQDMLQEGLIKVYEKLHTFGFHGSLEGWIKRIVVNTSLDHLRKTKHQQNQVEIETQDQALHYHSEVIESFSAKDLMGIIQKLPAGYRTVFNLFAIEGYNHREIAMMLGITESTSKSQFSRAKSHLQQMVLDHREEQDESRIRLGTERVLES